VSDYDDDWRYGYGGAYHLLTLLVAEVAIVTLIYVFSDWFPY
jgi:hypothetical protein